MTNSPPNPALGAALAYANTDVRVFPVARNKHPLTEHGKKDATTDEATIAGWWRRWPDANVAAVTGRAAGFFVLDVDPRHGGDVALAELQARHGPLPETLTCRTGGGGFHVYLLHPGGDIKTSQSKLGAGLDVLGEGASVILPPSVHLSGGRYSWADSSVPIARASAWVLAFVRPARRPAARPAPVVAASSSYVQRAVESEAARVHGAAEGTRNVTLNSAAFALGTLVGAGVLDEFVAVGVLLAAALASGLDENEATVTIESGIAAGKANPRRLGGGR